MKETPVPTVHGVGYLGAGEFRAYKDYKQTPAYAIWASILQRCYSELNQKKYPCYVGCTVDSVWHDFQVFAKWFYENHKEGLHLDKDVLVEGNKIYGPDTCTFVTRQVNNEKAWAKTYYIKSPDGEAVEVYNLAKFCREHNLDQPAMCHMVNGNYSNHKGWTLND